MTQRLYYDDSYTRAFSARIVERAAIGGQPAVALDRTYFYPTGGGQPHDTGTIGGVETLEVVSREDHAVIHLLASEVASDDVECAINFPRRFDHMQQHTGQHILTRAFIEVAGANTVAFHLGADSVTIDLNQTSLAPDVLDRVEDLANQIVAENRPITARIVSPDEFAALNVRARRMPDSLATDGIRIVEIANFDVVACGGTHVAHAGEVGIVKILKAERSAAETRIEFRCGGRALRDYRQKNTVANALAADLTVGIWEIDQAVARLKADLKESRSALKDAQARLIEHEAAALLAAAETRGGARVVRAVFSDRDVAEARTLASRLTAEAGVVALLGIVGDKAQLLLGRSADLPYDMSAALKRGLAALGTDRGGGRPEFAQGGGVPASGDQIRAALAEAEREAFE